MYPFTLYHFFYTVNKEVEVKITAVKILNCTNMIYFNLENISLDKIGVKTLGINFSYVIKNGCVPMYIINTHVNREPRELLVVLRDSSLSSLHIPFLFILNLV